MNGERERHRKTDELAELERGLRDAGLNDAEVQSFLGYSAEIERDLGPRAVASASPRLASWALVAAAVVLVVGGLGAAVGVLLGERSALKREIADLRDERAALTVRVNDQAVREGNLHGELAALEEERDSLKYEVAQRRRSDRIAQAEVLHFLSGQLGERISMGDREALRGAKAFFDAARELPERGVHESWHERYPGLGAHLDPLGLRPSTELESGPAMVLASRD